MKKVFRNTLFIVTTGILLCIVSQAVSSAPRTVTAVQERVVPFRGIIDDIQYSPFGSYLAVAARDSALTIYSSNLRTLWTYNGSHHYAKGTTVLAFTHNEKYLLFPRYRSSEEIAVLDLKTFTLADVLRGHSDAVRAIALNNDSSYLVSASSDDNLVLWELNGLQYAKTAETNSIHSRIGRITFHPSENMFACAHRDDTITVWSIENGKLKQTGHLKPKQYYGNTGYLYGMEFSPDGTYLVNGLREELTIWKKTGSEWTVHQVISDIKQGYVQSLTFSPDGQSFVCGFGRGMVLVFGLENGLFQQFDILDARQDYVEDISIHPDGTTLAAGSSDKTALAFWKTPYLAPSNQMLVQQALGGSTTKAQKQILTPAAAAAVVSEVDPFLFGPKDEFETDDEYLARKKELSATILKLVQLELENTYNITRNGSEKQSETLPGTISVNIQSLGTYKLEQETYPLTVLDTAGFIHIPRSEARTLKRGIGKAVMTAVIKPDPNGISFFYSDFTLVHPETGKFYPLVLEENPFHRAAPPQENVQEFIEFKAGPNLLVQGIEIKPVFPVLYRFYSTAPIGKIKLFNTGSVPVENVRLTLTMERYMDSISSGTAEPAVKEIPAGDHVEAEISALFNDSVLTITEGDTVSALLSIHYSAGGEDFQSTMVRTVRLMDRNAVTWDEDKKIAAFMTTKDPGILKFIKEAASIETGKPSVAALDSNMITALRIFETLKTVPGHIFTAFQLDFSPQTAAKVFSDNSGYIVKDNRVWIPVETTLFERGFLEAWNYGSKQWRENAERNTAGFFTTAEAWKIYEPVNFQINREIPFPAHGLITQSLNGEVDQFINRTVREHEQELEKEYETAQKGSRYLNKLGLMYSRFGFYDKALAAFEEAISSEEYLPGIMNAGNLCYIQGDLEKAVSYYLRATKQAPENPYIFIALSRAFYRRGEEDRAEEALGRARQIKPQLSIELPEPEKSRTQRASKPADFADILLSDEWE